MGVGPSADMSDSATKAHFKDYLNCIHDYQGVRVLKLMEAVNQVDASL
jgi:hypothetical protein